MIINEMAKRKQIKLRRLALRQIMEACHCSNVSVWRACTWNADTPKENEIREFIFANKLNKRF